MKKGFSLVELSIVLVIVGLLVGGILAGQSLIRASELRRVVTDADRYRTAAHAFRDKYFALPGDMTNATSVWGRNDAYCSGQPGAAATPGTCNGDGNGRIASGALDASTETHQLWNQLALAGMIEGSFSGISGSVTSTVPGVNAPESSLTNAQWNWQYWNFLPSGDTWNFAYEIGNRLRIHNLVTGAGVMRVNEAWNIDSKIDDGKPGKGRVLVVLRNNCTDSADAFDYDADYLLDRTSPGICSLDWRNMI
jgi:prepilin-type N-terminal cleavage/methylation domain-containing protein